MPKSSHRTLIVCLGSLLMYAGSAAADPEKGVPKPKPPPAHCLQHAEMGGDENGMVEIVLSPPLFDLIAHPERYDGCLVLVLGYFGRYIYPEGKLFLTRDDQEIAGVLFGSVWVNFKSKERSYDLGRVRDASGHMVLVEGRFWAGKGHPAYIGELRKFEVHEPANAEKH